mmetsp:Transcript_19169/g.39285  ORF Transcript_19169/g.39285 Transcript_19169/m.39285 type:complete len:710 (-) Transcript_19169:147-2276(-)
MKTFRNLSIILGTAHAADVQNICGTSVQVLFQSNAYARTLVPSGSSYPYQGGSVITTQGDWEIFLDYFEPNIEGQDLARRTVDFSSEKVAIGTYYASSTCNVVLDKALVECSTREDATYGTFAMDVTDGSRGCDISCMAVGQVVFAVAVPTAWEVDVQDGFEIDVSGGCISEDVSSGCPDGQPEVNCLVDPCEVNTCADGTVCRANYCGGCNFDCIIGTGSSPMHEITTEANLMTETTPPGVSKSSLCGENECLDSDGNCAGIVSCGVSPCLFDPCDEGEICKENYCGGCGFECVPSIPMDTTSTIFPTSSTIRMATPGSNQNGSGGLCGEHRTAFGGPAFSPYLVPNGQEGIHTTIITSQYDLNTLLASLTIVKPNEDNLSGFDGIDFETQQVIFVTYYTSSSCHAEFEGDLDYDCSKSSSTGNQYSLKITVDVFDESIGCQEACDSEIQLVFAAVTPLGADPSFINSVTGPCLEGNQSATKATTAGAETESTEAPSTKTQFPMSTTAAGSDTTVGPSTTTSTPDLLTTEVASTQSATASATEVNGDDEIVTSSTTAANTDFTTSSTSVSTPTSQTTAIATTTEISSSTTAATTKFTTNTTSNFPTTASSEITSTKTPDAFVSTTSTSLSTPSFRGATTTTFPTEYNITMNATLIPENPLSNVVGANDRGGFEFENSAIVEDTQSSSSMLSITAHFLLLSTVAMIFLM